MHVARVRTAHSVGLVEPVALTGLRRAVAGAARLRRSLTQCVLGFWGAEGSVDSLPHRH